MFVKDKPIREAMGLKTPGVSINIGGDEAGSFVNGQQPLVSFVTATLNAATTIGETIASVEREASGIAYEHIFIDGGSTDGTPDIIRRLKGPDANLISESDRGVYDAMNKGIRKARGEWIATINADDYYLPGGINKMLAAAERDPAATIVCGHVVVGWDQGEYTVVPDSGWRGRLGRNPAMIHPATWARRGVYERHGLYDLRYRLAADQEFFLRVFDAKEQAIYVAEPIVHFRAGGLSTRFYDAGTLEFLDLHASRRNLQGVVAQVLFYCTWRLRQNPLTPKKNYWLWALRDFFRRRLTRRR